MSWKTVVARTKGWLFGRDSRSEDLRREIESDVALETEENLERGMTPVEARRRALVKVGNPDRLHEGARAMWTLPSLENVVADVKFGARLLWKAPLWTAVAVLTLAIGIGANTAVFSVISALLVRSLPYPESDRLVWMWEREGSRVPRSTVSYPDFRDWQAQAKTFSSIAAFTGTSLTISGNGDPRYVDGQRTTAEFFRVLDVAPQLGRTYSADEERYGNHYVIVLSDGLWRTMFGGDPNIVGKKIQVNSNPYEVIGVMPKGFFSLEQTPAAAWVPFSVPPSVVLQRAGGFLHVAGRVKRGVPIAQAEAEIAGITAQIAKTYPESREKSSYIVPMQEQLTQTLRPALFATFGAVLLVLLIGCANLANLVLARSVTRRREMAIRVGIGATRSRILLQLATENLLIAVLGAAAGLVLAFVLVRVFSSYALDYLPPIRELSIDLPTLGFAAAALMFVAVLFGVLPAWKASSVDPQEVLKENTVASIGSHSRLKKALIIGEVALSVVLLSGALLLIGSVREMLRVDLGFESQGAIAARVPLPNVRYPKDEQRMAFFGQLLDRVRAHPEITAAGATLTLPLGFGDHYWTMLVRPDQPSDPAKIPTIAWLQVTPGYVEAMHMPLIAGRSFTDADDMTHPMVTIVSENLARKNFAGEDPLGKQIKFGISANDPPMTIVGVVASAPVDSIADDMPGIAYTPHRQGVNGVSGNMVLVLRSSNLSAAREVLRSELRKSDPQVAIAEFATLDEVVQKSVRTPRGLSALVSVFAIIAVGLAGIGIFGVLMYAVAQRKREVGIRMALGANRESVMTMILRESLVLVAIGCGMGVAGAVASAMAVRSLLFGVGPTNPVALTAGAVGVALVALAAAAWPARKAMSVDPLEALRYE